MVVGAVGPAATMTWLWSASAGHEVETVEVLTVTSKVEAWEMLTAENTQTVAWPASSLPPAALRAADHELPLVAQRHLAPGQPLQGHHAHPPFVHTFFLPDGVKAATLPVQGSPSMLPFFQRGSSVDFMARDRPRGQSIANVLIVESGVRDGTVEMTVLATEADVQAMSAWAAGDGLHVELGGCDFGLFGPRVPMPDLSMWREATEVRWCHRSGGGYVDPQGRACEADEGPAWVEPELRGMRSRTGRGADCVDSQGRACETNDRPAWMEPELLWKRPRKGRGENCIELEVVVGGEKVVRSFDDKGLPCDEQGALRRWRRGAGTMAGDGSR